jgi:serine/threonine protein kinase/Flp pilus assembly protein TadD
MIGESILHYQVLAKIGEGGMGIVYSALDARLGRTVALKVLPPGKSNDPKRRQRFLREARAAAALNHPNIVGIYDIGHDHGVDFIAMELVAGRSLYQLMRRAQLPLSEILSYSSQIASALAKAHAAGVVHRDLKPGNVMITDEGSVKLLDFGLAQLNPVLTVADAGLQEETATESAITEMGVAVGTLQYMSPEQARGETVDKRSDIFSFGVLLYEMLGGSRPFHASSAVALLHAIGYDQPKPIAELRGDIPAGLQEIVSRCLQKQPEARFGSMEPVATALRTMVRDSEDGSARSGGPILDPPSTPAPPQRSWKRYGWITAAALAAVAIIGGLSPPGRRVWQSFRGSRFASAVHLPSGAAEWNRRGQAFLFRYDKAGNVDQAIESFQQALQQDRDNAAAYAGLGEAYAYKHEENQDPQWLRLAKSNASRAVQLGELLADAHVSMGYALSEALDYPNAEREFRRAIELEPSNADALRLLGYCLDREKRPKEAGQLYGTLIQKHPDDWRAYHYLGGLLYRTGRYEEAISAFLKASSLAPDNASVYRILGLAYHMLDRDAEATEALQKALAIRPYPSVFTNLGAVYFYEGRYLDAMSAFQRAISSGANSYGNWGNLGDAYRLTPGNESKAREAYSHAIQLVEAQLSKTPDDTSLRSDLAALLAKNGQKERAQREIQRAQSSSKLDGPSLFQLAIASELTADRPNALELLGKAVKSGFGLKRIQNEPDLIALRRDPGYHRIVLAPAKEEEPNKH